jgi:rod shape-determining protein MreD
MKRFLLPLLVLFFFVLDSVFVQLLSAELYNSKRIMVPHFLAVIIIFLTIYGSKKHGVIYGLIFGLLFDIVYTDIIGIYLFMLPLLAYFASKIIRVLHTNLAVVALITVFELALLELGVYEMNFLIHRTNMEFSAFLQQRLLPTLVLNLAFIIVVSFPFKKYFEKFARELDEYGQ